MQIIWALKAEETELNEPTAAPLDEIISRKDTSNSQIQSTVDSAGHLRVTRTKNKSKLPTTTEEYRRVMRVEMFSWLAMSARYKSKHWLHGLEASHFNKCVDFVLGDRVLGIQNPLISWRWSAATGQAPTGWIVLSFEHKLRKEAMRLVIHENHTLGAALIAVTRDAELKEAFFTTPVALKSILCLRMFLRTSGPGTTPRERLGGKTGFQPSKGKGGKKGRGKGKDSRLAGLQLAWRTPDGRDLCFAV